MPRILYILLLFGIGLPSVFAQETDSLDTVLAESVDSVASPMDSVFVRKDTLTIMGVGDIMMGTDYPESRLPPQDGKFLMEGVKEILASADLTFGNLEGVLLDSGGTPKSCRDPKVCYVFRSPTAYVQNLADAGFDVMSLANNHAGDFGDAGRSSSMKVLDSAGIEHAGLLTKPFVLFTRDSIRYGFTAFAPNSGCNSLNDLANAKAIVRHLDSLSDIVIVSFHGGAEGANYQHVPRTTEVFHGENRGNVYAFAHALIDEGADIIFGHGPHVTRAIEVYRNRFIAYSMGNFCTYRGINIAGVNGLAPIVTLKVTSHGEFIGGSIIPTIQSHTSGVRVDDNKQVIAVMQQLTEKDFPESVIQIDGNGTITYIAQQHGVQGKGN